MKKIITLKENALRDIVKESLFSILNKERNKQLDIESVFHFSQIPTEELKQQYVDYSFYDKINGYKYINTINESVDIYLQAQNAKDEMTRLFGLKDWQVVVYKGNHKVEVILLYAGILKNTKIIKNEMKRLGFFPSISSFQFRGFMLWRAIKFEPYNQYDLTKKARRFGVLYHLTPEYNVDNIKFHGLIPSSKNQMFDYPNRVYVLYGNIDENNIICLGRQLYEKAKKKDKLNTGKYVLYKINVHKIPLDVQFYGDPNYPYGYFTYQEIPKDALTPVKVYQF